MRPQNELPGLVDVIERETGLLTPIRPDMLAAALGITLMPKVGARYALSTRRELTYDPTSPRADEFVAFGCAAYFLRQAGLLKEATVSIAALATALCANAAPRTEPIWDRLY